MSIKKILITICSIMTFLTIFGSAPKHNQTRKVDAAGGQNWVILGGSGQSGSDLTGWSNGIPLTYDATDDYYYIFINLVAGDEFKFFYNNGSDNWVGWTTNAPAEFTGSYKSNVKCTVTGRWKLGVDGKTVDTYGDWNYGFRYGKRAALVSYYNDGNLIDKEDCLQGISYSARNITQTGYSLEGWYTNSQLTTRYVNNSTLNGNLSLYGNYIPSTVKYVYVKNNPRWSNIHAYLWSHYFGNNNADWPGLPMTKVAGTDIMYYYEIPAEANFDRIIFNIGSNAAQTSTAELIFGDNLIYNVSQNSFTVTTYSSYANKVILEGESLATLETECFKYDGAAALTSDVYFFHLVNGSVVIEPVADSAKRVEKIKNYIMSNAGCSTTQDLINKYYDLYNTLTDLEKAEEGMAEVKSRLDYINSIISLNAQALEKSFAASVPENFLTQNSVALLLIIGFLMAATTTFGIVYYKKKPSKI